DEERVTYDTGKERKIVFERNYRSSKRILEFSRRTLFIQGSNEEVMDLSEIDQNFKESLKPVRDLDDLSEIEFYLAENRRQEILLILKKISQLVNEKDKYIIRDFDKATGEPAGERPVKYSDICVLTRNKVFGLELQRTALKLGIPVDYHGGIELFSSEPGILVLAWLRLLLNDKNIFGWMPVLDKEGYSFNEQKYLLNKLTGKYYDQQHLFNTVETGLDGFLNSLKAIKENILYLVEAILRRYHYNDEVANKIISVIKVWMGSDIISVNDLVNIIDRSKRNEYDFEINANSGSALVQTIHLSKGLEYPVVIVANCNTQIFPNTKGDMLKFFYNPVLGLRMKKIFGSNGKYDYLFDNWRTDLTQSVIKKPDYDEERRLLYVGVTRAKQYVYFTSHNSSAFFTNLSNETGFVPVEDFDYEIKYVKTESENQKIEIKADALSEAGRKFISPHSLMDKYIPDESNKAGSKSFSVKAGKDALEFGNSIHKAAHRIASGVDTPVKTIELKRVKDFIEDLKARELKSEVDFIFPRGDEVIRGTIDLLAFYDDRIEVIDYKTDKNKSNLEKYRIQMSVYKDVVKSIYPDKKITGKIFFVCVDEVVEI
ncbi:MAG: 3'-5' exonuclease, partial [bacterium]